MKWKKGSYTIEASFIVPILFFSMAIGMLLAIDLYQEIMSIKDEDVLQQLWAVESFYRDNWIGGMLKGEH